VCFEALEADPEVEVEVRRLGVGDYAVADRILVERKTVPDFAASLIDGRLFRQAARLASQVELSPFILLEGTAREAAATGVSRAALLGAVTTISVILGIPLLRAVDGHESSRILVYAGRQIQAHRKGRWKRGGYQPKSKAKIQMLMLQAVPGIGPQRAKSLLEVFGSLEAILTAPADELASVDGIGQKTAITLTWVLSQPRPSGYGVLAELVDPLNP